MGIRHAEFLRGAQIHPQVAVSYSSSAARLAATGFTLPHIIAKQTNNNTYWVLASISPITWIELTNVENVIPGGISDTVSADTNNWNPGTTWSADTEKHTVYLTLSADDWQITGLTGGSLDRRCVVLNRSAYRCTLKHESASSTAANRFAFYANQDLSIPPYGAAIFRYDSVNSRWRSALAQAGMYKVGNAARTVCSGSDSRLALRTREMNGILFEREGHFITTGATAGTGRNAGFNAVAIGGGVLNTTSVPTDAMHQGRDVVAVIRSNTAAANNGWRWISDNTYFTVSDGLYQDSWRITCRFWITTVAGHVWRIGFHDATSATAPVDGVYMQHNGTEITLKMRNNSTETTGGDGVSPTSYVPTAGKWYTVDVSWTPDPDYEAAYLSLYEDDVAGDLTPVYEAAIYADAGVPAFPAGVARAVSMAVIATRTAASAAEIGAVSYIGYSRDWAAAFNMSH